MFQYFVSNTCFFLFLVTGNYAARIAVSGAVYMTAALEYLVAEVMELAGDCARDNHRITPRHIKFAIQNDEELNEMLKGVSCPHCKRYASYSSGFLTAKPKS